MPTKTKAKDEEKEFIDMRVIQPVDGKRSNRVLVQTSEGDKKIFVPRRRSFGIIVKPRNPERLPARVLRSISREFSTSTRDIRRSPSVTSLTLVRRKSCSLGNIDQETFFEDEEQAQSLSRASSYGSENSLRFRRRSRSAGSRDSARSRSPMNRQRSREFSDSSTGRQSSEDIFAKKSRELRNQRKLRFGLDVNDTEDESESSQYEAVQQRKHRDNFMGNTIHHEIQYHSPPEQRNLTANLIGNNLQNHHEVSRNESHSTVDFNDIIPIKRLNVSNGFQSSATNLVTNGNQFQNRSLNEEIEAYQRKFGNFNTSSSDEGTEIDDQPWYKPSVESSPSKFKMPIKNNKGSSFSCSMSSENEYRNLEELAPMLPPKRPPKSFNPELNNRLLMGAKANSPKSSAPALPPKSVSLSHQAGSWKSNPDLLRSTERSPFRNQGSLDDRNVYREERNPVKDMQRREQFQHARYNGSRQDIQKDLNYKNRNNFHGSMEEPRTHRGIVQSEGSVENTDATPIMKKSRSQVVLDDISLASYDSKEKISTDPHRGSLECWSGVLHLLVICSSLLCTVTMAIVSSKWDQSQADACPLFVDTNLEHTRYWGNPNKVPCYICAYLPLLNATISLVLMCMHGILLFFWRNDKKVSTHYNSRSFGTTLWFLNLFCFCTALAVAATLSDGLRQTCLSFKLISDMQYRPTSCQNGLYSMDLNYDMEGSFYLIIFGIIGSWLSVFFSGALTILYTVSIGWCQCCVR